MKIKIGLPKVKTDGDNWLKKFCGTCVLTSDKILKMLMHPHHLFTYITTIILSCRLLYLICKFFHKVRDG